MSLAAHTDTTPPPDTAMQVSDPHTDPEGECDGDHRPKWRRLVDSVFGYDFFISYKWMDGRKYAETLARELKSHGFEVFLDSERYGQGDDWKKIGAWILKRTGQMILVATKLALEPGETETPVEREVRIFAETRRRIIPISFAPRRSDGTFDRPASTIQFARQNSRVLRYILPETLVVEEDASLQSTAPSKETIERIRKTFNLVRQDKKRVAIFSAISLVLVVLTVAAVVLGARAEVSRRTVATQLAERLYTSAAAAESPLDAFLLTAKAAQTSPVTNDKLSLYLDRVMHLSTRLPNLVVNLPVTEGVDFAAFTSKLDRVALVTDNRNIHIFTIPDGKELFVPDFVNSRGIAGGTQPSFDDDGITIRTYLSWFHPEPDPDETGNYVLAADWNVENRTVLTPIDNGIIPWDKLSWTVIGRAPVDDRGRTYSQVYADEFNSIAFFQSLPQLAGKSLPTRGARVNGNLVAAASANSRIMFWLKEESDQLITATSPASDQKGWVTAAFSRQYLVTLDSEHLLTVWKNESKEKVWTHVISERESEFQIAPDESVVAVGNSVYRLSDGTLIGVLPSNKEDFQGLEKALTTGGKRMSAWTFYTGNSNDLSFDLEDPAVGGETKSFEADAKSNFIHFLADGRYCMIGSRGSFQIRDIVENRTVAFFYFGTTSRLAPALANALLCRSVGVEIGSSNGKVMLHLRGGGRLEIGGGSEINRDLRLARDDAVLVSPRMNKVDRIGQLTLSPDGRWLATLREGNLQVWDARTGHPLIESIRCDGEVLDVQFTADSRRLLIATTRGTIVTAVVSFPWKGKPVWLDDVGEALIGQTIADDGDTQVLPLQDASKLRSKLLNQLASAGPQDTAAACLRTRFEMPVRK